MYYVNREQIEYRLNMVPDLIQVLEAVGKVSNGESVLLARFAEERALHMAIEIVTDAGSFLIDGFIMRDASSYEDIVDIMYDEKVIDEPLFHTLTDLVRLRKPLVQEYYDWDRSGAHPLTRQLPQVLEDFSRRVRAYLDKEGIQ